MFPTFQIKFPREGDFPYCRYIYAGEPGLTWEEAMMAAESDGTSLIEITHPLLQEAAETQMIWNGATEAWLGATGEYEYPLGPWRWLEGNRE